MHLTISYTLPVNPLLDEHIELVLCKSSQKHNDFASRNLIFSFASLPAAQDAARRVAVFANESKQHLEYAFEDVREDRM